MINLPQRGPDRRHRLVTDDGSVYTSTSVTFFNGERDTFNPRNSKTPPIIRDLFKKDMEVAQAEGDTALVTELEGLADGTVEEV